MIINLADQLKNEIKIIPELGSEAKRVIYEDPQRNLIIYIPSDLNEDQQSILNKICLNSADLLNYNQYSDKTVKELKTIAGNE